MSEAWSTFGFTEEQRLMRESVLDLLGRVLPAAKIRELDAKGEFPADAYSAMARAGWMALPFKEEYGGSVGSYKDLAVLIESIKAQPLPKKFTRKPPSLRIGQHSLDLPLEQFRIAQFACPGSAPKLVIRYRRPEEIAEAIREFPHGQRLHTGCLNRPLQPV